MRLWGPGAASGRACGQATGPGLPSPSLSLPGNSSLGLGLRPSPAGPQLRLRSIWTATFLCILVWETSSCCVGTAHEPSPHFFPWSGERGAQCVQGCAGASVGVGECMWGEH